MFTQPIQNDLKLFKQIPSKIKNLEAEKQNQEKSKKSLHSNQRISSENDITMASKVRNSKRDKQCLQQNNIVINKSCSQLKQNGKCNRNMQKKCQNENRPLANQNGSKKLAKQRYITSQHQNLSQFDDKTETKMQVTANLAESKNNKNNCQFNFNEILGTSMSNYHTKESNLSLQQTNCQLVAEIQAATKRVIELEQEISEYECHLQEEKENNQFMKEQYEQELETQKKETGHLLSECQKKQNQEISIMKQEFGHLMILYQQLQEEQTEKTNRQLHEQKEQDVRELEEKINLVVNENSKLLQCLEQRQKQNKQQEEEMQSLKAQLNVKDTQIQNQMKKCQIIPIKSQEVQLQHNRLNSCTSTFLLQEEQQKTSQQPQGGQILQKSQYKRLSHFEKPKSMMDYQMQQIYKNQNQIIQSQQCAQQQQPQFTNFVAMPNSTQILTSQQPQQQINRDLSKGQQKRHQNSIPNFIQFQYANQ